MEIDIIPTWIDKTSNLNGDHFKKIFIFSVINVPLIEKSARAIQLPKNIKIPISYKAVNNAKDMDIVLKDNNLYTFPPAGDYEERAVFVRSNDSVVVCFIDHIRNSIAHGRFNIIKRNKDNILIMEDKNKKDCCSARIVIRTKTMVDWIDSILEVR